MFEISIKMTRSTTKKSSKFVSLFRSMFYTKPKSSVVDSDPISREPVTESSILPSSSDHSEPKLSIIKLDPISIESIMESSSLPSSNDLYMMMAIDSIRSFIRIFERFTTKISFVSGIFVGFYAFYQIYFSNINQQIEELELFECKK